MSASTPSQRSGLVAPGHNLPPCERDQLIDPSTCELLPGHQHGADDIDELAESIAIVGQLHAGQVFELPDGRRWIAAGRRRWLACKQRGFLYRADVWKCANEASVRGEDLARAIRVVENDQRRDPSAYDLAVQLRRIRNENAFQSAEEVARHIGMSVARVKKYLSIFQASDDLLAAIERDGLSITVALELVKCEKQFGEVRARKYVRGVIAGELGAADLERRRAAAAHGAAEPKRKDPMSGWSATANRLKRLAESDPIAARPLVETLCAELEAVVGCASGPETEP